MRQRSFAVSCGLLVLIAACSDSTGSGGACAPATSLASGATNGVNLLVAGGGSMLAPLQGLTINAANLTGCLSLAGDSGTYLVVPQFATDGGPQSPVSFELGVGTGASASLVAQRSVAGSAQPLSARARFDAALRAVEHRIAPETPQALAEWRASRASADIVAGAATLPALGSTRVFHVLSSITGQGSFDTDTATLRYIGTNIMVYVDKNAPPAPDGFTDEQYAGFGQSFDNGLYEIDVNTFGAPSDIDGNGHVIVLFTPTVNRITALTDCSSGFVAGFFYGVDLSPQQQNSNAGEIFYSLVPDPNGDFSCKHTQEQIDQITPATFIHEFQHMISWNQHVILRRGPDEDLWLNEGMSHIAEEMGSRYYENKYPAPLGRSNPAQVFPDSAEGFIVGDLFNSYDYLLDPTQWSITEFIHGGSLEERGGAWLFLRWLGDQKDSTIYKRLEQTNLTGIANVEAAAGERFPVLFGDFSTAVYTDSLPGIARTDIPARFRFKSRNLRFLYNVLYQNRGTNTSEFPRPFPIEATPLDAPGSVSASMVPGTASYLLLQMPNDGTQQVLRFTGTGGVALNQTTLKGQVTIFRCPAGGCQ